MNAAGFVLCGLLTGADYGSTKIVLQRPGVYEAGPIARHSLVAGAALRTSACVAGEVALRKKPKARRIYRIAGLVGTGIVVGLNLKQGR